MNEFIWGGGELPIVKSDIDPLDVADENGMQASDYNDLKKALEDLRYFERNRYKPFAHYTRTGSDQVIASGGGAIIDFNNQILDITEDAVPAVTTGAAWQFRTPNVPAPGTMVDLYMVNVKVGVISGAAGNGLYLHVRFNGTDYNLDRAFNLGNGEERYLQGSMLFESQGEDFIDAKVNTIISTGNISVLKPYIFTTIALSQIQIYRVGRRFL